MLLLQGDRPQSSGLPQAEAAVKQVVSYPALAAVRKGQPAGIDYADYPLPPDLAVTVDPLGITQTAVMTFSGKIGRCDATILMDSGASYNFIAHDFITKHHITTTAAFDGPTIRVADGTLYQCTQALSTTVRIGFYQSKILAYILPLKGNFDVILGTPWLTACNPTIDWQRRTVTVTQNGQKLELQPTKPVSRPIDDTPIISVLEAYQELCRGGQLFLAIVRAKDDTTPDSGSLDRDSRDPSPAELKHARTEQALDNETQAKIREHVERLKREFADVMPDQLPDELPPKRAVDHKITLVPGATPPNQRYYRLSYEEQAECKRQLEDGLAKGHIRPSTSPWGSPVLFVKKKDGSYRMCIDYRALNALTIKNRTPLPRVDDLMDQIRGAKWFTSLDLRQGYNQIRMDEESIPLTAFKTKWGLFEYTVMSFGLCNAPATFQTMMNDLFRAYLDQWLVIFLDDMLIYDRDLDTHAHHVATVLQILRENKLFVKESKCDWFKPEVHFLGHRISADGVSMDDGKVQAILNWSAPRNVAQVRSFLGLAGYYRHFIQRFAHTALPLTRLTKGGNPFQWGEEQSAAFEELKRRVTTAPVLAYPDPDKPFTVTADASDYAIGAVLSQDQGKGLQPIAFYSRQLSPPECNYPTHDKEMLALIVALKQWRHYLMSGLRHQAYTDHCALKHFASQPNLSPRQTRWMGTLQEYNISIDYLPGRSNVVADALSRQPALATSITTVHTMGDFLSQLKASYGQDEESKAILDSIASGSTEEYSLQDGLVLRQTKTGKQLYIPPSAADQRKQLLADHHDSILAGHLGMDKTYACLARNYYWPTMREDVRQHIRTCPCCQVNKSSNAKPAGLLQPLPIPERSWEVVSMDFITNLPKTTSGHDAILVCVDKRSKMMHAVPTHTTATAPQTAELYFNTVTRLHGIQSGIISDRDPKFTSKFWEALMNLWRTKLGRSTAYHPQTDGQTERMNRLLQEILRAYVSQRHDDWDKRLAAAEFAINNSPSASSGQSPFYLNYGFHPLTPATLGLRKLSRANNQAAQDFWDRMQTDLSAAKDLLEQAQERQARYANTKRADAEFAVGDQVLLSTANLRLRTDGPAGKFNPRWCGPFKILERIGKVAYKLELPSTMRVHPVFHVSLLKTYHSSDDSDRPQPPRPPPIQDEDVFLADTLLDRRTVKQGKRTVVEYLVKWEGYPLYEATWEPASHLLGTDLKKMRQEMDKRYQQAARDLAATQRQQPAAPPAAAPQQAAATSPVRRSTRQRKPAAPFSA
jgi:hypothetical protein